MGFKDIFARFRSRISGVGAAPAIPLSPEEQLVRDYDLYLVDLHDELPALAPQRDAMRAAWLKGDFEAYEQAFEAARASGVIADNGKPLYSLVKDWFLEPFMALPDDEAASPQHEDMLKPFRDFFHLSPSAFSAATYADALRVTAFVRRGTGWGRDLRADQWQGYEALLKEADEVLDSHADPENFSWRISDYRRSANEGDFETFKARFERAWLLDRYNIDLCRSHARMIMPRRTGSRRVCAPCGGADEGPFRPRLLRADPAGKYRCRRSRACRYVVRSRSGEAGFRGPARPLSRAERDEPLCRYAGMDGRYGSAR
jgi:hypothetical protein